MDVQQNIYLAIQALRLELIDTADFVGVFHSWSENKSQSITSRLVADGHITGEQETALEQMLKNDIESGADLSEELAEMADLRVRDALRLVKDSDIQLTLAGLAPADGVSLDDVDAPTRSPERYEVSRQYAEGALGRIWLAQDRDLQREVVLKELHPARADEPDLRRRFLNEARITGQLEHPNIVPVYELGSHEEGGRLYYTMRFVRGETLKDAIVRHHNRSGGVDTLESRRLLGVFVSVCNAIAYASSRGVIHRDLKPENVVLGAFGEAVLLDWGLAKLAGTKAMTTGGATADAVALHDDENPGLTAVGSVMGTPAYMAPEQAAGETERLDHRTDVYGLGAILYEILTGTPPHLGTDAVEVVRQIVSEPSPAPRATNSRIPAPLDAICVRAMAKDPEARYPSATVLAGDISRWLADEPVSAYPEPFRVRAARWMRRNRGTTLAAATVLLSIGFALLNLWWQRSSAIDHELEMLGRQNRQASGRLNALIDILLDDVRYLAEFGAVPKILETQDNSDEQAHKDARSALAASFGEFVRHRRDYVQVRLIGLDGDELVRVERTPGRPDLGSQVISRVTGLPNKQARPYFADAIDLSAGQVYLSDVELNREAGKVSTPRTPVIRAAVPVFRDGDEDHPGADGVVVINVMFEPLFEMLRGQFGVDASRSPDVYVTDSSGYFLWATEPGIRTFALEEDPDDPGTGPAKLQDRYPEIGSFFATRGSMEHRRAICDGDPEDLAVHVYPLRFDPGRPGRFLGLAVATPHGLLEANARYRYEFPLYATWALVLALAVTLGWVVWRAFNPRS